MNEAVWTIKNVSFAYKHEPETLHITETSFPSGSATAIIGHNGAGKSTFARCLCGLEKHFKGTVQDRSKIYSRKERLKLCYMVMQHMGVSKPSVCHAVSTLKEGGFLTMDGDFFLRLTDVGREVAEQTYEKHCFFTRLLVEAGVDPKTAE